MKALRADYATRRSSRSAVAGIQRRSSRRDAPMQARIARMDTSNLSTYSLPTLRRLSKDMHLEGYMHLTKAELVVRIVAEMLITSKGYQDATTGWGGRQGTVQELRRTVKPSARALRNQVVYRFGGARGAVAGNDKLEAEREVLAGDHLLAHADRALGKLPRGVRQAWAAYEDQQSARVGRTDHGSEPTDGHLVHDLLADEASSVPAPVVHFLDSDDPDGGALQRGFMPAALPSNRCNRNGRNGNGAGAFRSGNGRSANATYTGLENGRGGSMLKGKTVSDTRNGNRTGVDVSHSSSVEHIVRALPPNSASATGNNVSGHAITSITDVQEADIEQEFECLAKLPMENLQELCDDMGIVDWSTMRKCDMVSTLLADLYGVVGVS